MLFEIIVATLIVSLISLVGIVLIGLKKEFLSKVISLLVSFAVGAMLGGAFLHILPEALEEEKDSLVVFSLLMVGFVTFLIIEKVIHWRHCHDEKCPIHPVAYLNLVGDGVHNFMDGAVIATSFMTDLNIGIASTIAIIAHEIPQEIGDFGVLLHAGLDKKKAIMYNLLSALAAVIGALVAYFFIATIPTLLVFLLPLAAGGFIYIAAVDLIPELHKEKKLKMSILQLILMSSGIFLMYYLKITLGG